MTEYEAWNYIANPNNWRKSPTSYRFIFEGQSYGKGLCEIVYAFLRDRKISKRTYRSMKKKIAEYHKATPGRYHWSVFSKYGNTQRRKFCKEQMSRTLDSVIQSCANDA